MKPSTLLFLISLSLAANAALLLQLVRPAPEPRMAGETEAMAATSGTSGSSSHGSALRGADVETELMWRDLPVDDLPALVARLRSEGLPPNVVRAIVSALVHKDYEGRMNALRSSQEPPAYWKGTMTSRLAGDMQTRAALRELSLEQAERIKSLLGPNAESVRDPYYLAVQRRQYGDLDPDRIRAVQTINSDYSELMSQIRSEAQGLLLPEDREKLAFLEAEKEKDLRALLSAEEMEELQLRSSSTANTLRSRLIAMEPTEQEFRTLFRLQQSYDEQFGTNQRRNTPEWRAQQQAAERQLIADAKAALGEERGSEYERSRDYAYVQTYQLVTQHNLPKSAALEVWNVQKDTLARMSALGNVSPAERQALAQEVTAKLKASLGEDVYPSYRQSAGSWLNALEQQARPPSPPAAR